MLGLGLGLGLGVGGGGGGGGGGGCWLSVMYTNPPPLVHAHTTIFRNRSSISL